jgi:hypothetical protein
MWRILESCVDLRHAACDTQQDLPPAAAHMVRSIPAVAASQHAPLTPDAMRACSHVISVALDIGGEETGGRELLHPVNAVEHVATSSRGPRMQR